MNNETATATRAEQRRQANDRGINPVNLCLDFLGGECRQPSDNILSTGFAGLDDILPEGGWPEAAVSEIFCAEELAHHVLPLVFPALARLSQAKRWLTWVAPPNRPKGEQLVAAGVDLNHMLVIHPHATSNGLWAVEQALRLGTSEAVLSWATDIDPYFMQDLRGAALAGNSCGILFRPSWAIGRPSCAALRLNVVPDMHGGLYVELLKGTEAQKAIYLQTASALRKTG